MAAQRQQRQFSKAPTPAMCMMRFVVNSNTRLSLVEFKVLDRFSHITLIAQRWPFVKRVPAT